jgi:uncharacterized membrane protein YhaH (DUF805 family)
MGPFTAIGRCFRKYADFSGRARRAEYWWFALLFYLPALLVPFSIPLWLAYDRVDHVGMITAIADGIWALCAWYALLFLPHLSVTARRVHDTNASAWWLLLMLTGLGNIVFLIWAFIPGTSGPNRFGPDPLQEDAAARQSR